MDLRYDTEHAILRSSAEKFLAERYDYRSFQKIADSEAGWSREIWAEFATLGWLGLPFALEDGGSGGGAVELAILMEAFGKHLVIEPYLATVVLGGGLVASLGSAAERLEMLPAVIDGSCRLAFAHEDRGAATQALRTSAGYVLQGAKKVVLGGEMADTLLLSARLGDGGMGVFVLHKGTRGLTLRPYRLVDGSRAADVELADVTVPASALLGGNEDAGDAVTHVLDRAIAALSADAVGAIAAMVKATVDYAKTRVQFGQPIANFQALQHRMVKHEDQGGRGARRRAVRDAQPRRRGGHARPCRLRRQGQDRPLRALRAPGCDPAPRRHRHHRTNCRSAATPSA